MNYLIWKVIKRLYGQDFQSRRRYIDKYWSLALSVISPNWNHMPYDSEFRCHKHATHSHQACHAYQCKHVSRTKLFIEALKFERVWKLKPSFSRPDCRVCTTHIPWTLRIFSSIAHIPEPPRQCAVWCSGILLLWLVPADFDNDVGDSHFHDLWCFHLAGNLKRGKARRKLKGAYSLSCQGNISLRLCVSSLESTGKIESYITGANYDKVLMIWEFQIFPYHFIPS